MLIIVGSNVNVSDTMILIIKRLMMLTMVMTVIRMMPMRILSCKDNDTQKMPFKSWSRK